ncbi:MAG: hypothetical protein JWO05_976 [Gemmatimonadetes bacterium]|nr:hypothetical protein [Gemmatimonadota bacterium]
MPSPLRTALAAVVLAAGAYVGSKPIGPAPALGPFLEPARGVWALGRTSSLPDHSSAHIPGLSAETKVEYDDRAVPHIFAPTTGDAYRALGYVVARDRLFQMYLQTMAASGRLTEVAGAAALPLDREMRRLGLPRTAERKLEALKGTPTMTSIEQYSQGVNAYIDGMAREDMPLEFRLIRKKPERWTPINAMHLLNRMGWTLSYIIPEEKRAAAATRVGNAAAASIFPDVSPIVEPIQPNGQKAPREDMIAFVAPGAPETNNATLASLLRGLMPARERALELQELDASSARGFASNNWAVSPSRSADHHALLAGDPHLDLTLPSIWYEAHMVVPNALDVYGVTIPGSNEIVIGFNRDIAWTFTNSETDVIDFWREKVDDDAMPAKYQVDGAWRPLERRIEQYRGRFGEVIATDTLLFTHRGPMRREHGEWISMRWTVNEVSDELAAFQGISTAKNVDEFQAAMGAHYMAPAQNMLVADRGGHISIRSTGRFPIRAGDGSGNVLRDGTSSANEWKGYVPLEQMPQAKDPAQGYVASANQQPVDVKATGGYWGGLFFAWRALRINRLLRADSSVTVDAMRRFQTDPGSERAERFAPLLVRVGMASNDERSRQSAMLLGEWNREYTRDNTRAVLFEAVMRELRDRAWDELAVDPHGSLRRRVATPDEEVLWTLTKDSSNTWWDDRRTAQRVERRDDIIDAALAAGLDSVRHQYGEPGDGWRWEKIQTLSVKHLLPIKAFASAPVSLQGGPSTLNPSGGRSGIGSSWRMVVDLGPELKAWGTYPGGQSGNVASDRYHDRIDGWSRGELLPLFAPKTAAEAATKHRSTLTLTGGN